MFIKANIFVIAFFLAICDLAFAERISDYFGIYSVKPNDTIPNQEALSFKCSLQAIYLITNNAIPSPELFAKIVKKLNLPENEEINNLEDHTKQKIREWFDIHEKSFNNDGYLKYNHPMTYQINFNQDTKLTGNYLYEWLSDKTKRLTVYKNENNEKLSKDFDEKSENELLSKVVDDVKGRNPEKSKITQKNLKNYWNLCRMSSVTHEKPNDICEIFTLENAKILSELENEQFYNLDYAKSKLRAEPILKTMKSKLMEGLGSAVTYINFVNSHDFMALFDVLNVGLIKYYKKSKLLHDSKTGEKVNFTTGKFGPLLSTFTILKRKCPSSKSFEYDVYLNGDLWRDGVSEDDFKNWIFEKALKNEDDFNIRYD
ncbi:uncharacterized protein LOC134832233 [Culicoides brevitarsis]|uniref:uncharacterized protein LOC134832233 n=1 Tax=Culicoides brevitarsis TaxID=469753 RepID=UPI00307C65F5